MNGAITVTSSNQSDNDVNCNFGNPVTVAAPGEGILSTAPGGGTATMSGTSMATPHVAGAALLYLQSHPGASPTQVEQGIVNDLDPWSTNDNPNADGRLDAEDL
jgi:subtilisin family serine protease